VGVVVGGGEGGRGAGGGGGGGGEGELRIVSKTAILIWERKGKVSGTKSQR